MITHDVDYGHHWTLADGRRCRLSWNADTGVLYITHPDPLVDDAALVAIASRDNVEDLLTGWDDRSGGQLGWLNDRLALVGAQLPADFLKGD